MVLSSQKNGGPCPFSFDMVDMGHQHNVSSSSRIQLPFYPTSLTESYYKTHDIFLWVSSWQSFSILFCFFRLLFWSKLPSPIGKISSLQVQLTSVYLYVNYIEQQFLNYYNTVGWPWVTIWMKDNIERTLLKFMLHLCTKMWKLTSKKIKSCHPCLAQCSAPDKVLVQWILHPYF